MARADAVIGRVLRRLFDGEGIAETIPAELGLVVRGEVDRPPGKATAAMKAAAVILAVASLISAGAGLAAHGGRVDESPRMQVPPQGRTTAGPRAIALDRYRDPLPEGAIARLGAMRFRHNYFGGNWSTVTGVAYTPDGHSLVTVGAGEARVWDVPSEHLIRTIDVDLAALSPDGKTLFGVKSAERFSGGSKPGMLRAVDLSTGRELRQVVIAPAKPVKLMALSPDGKSVAVLTAKHQTLHGPLPPATIVVYDAATFAERRRITLQDQYVNALAFSTGSRMLAVAALDGEGPEVNREPKASSVRLYDATTGDLMRRFSFEAMGIGSVAFTPDGNTLAVGLGDWTIRLFDPATGRERVPRLVRDARVVQPKMGPGAMEDRQWPRAVGCLAFSPDSSLLASGPGWGGSQSLLTDWPPITLWDVAAAKEIRRFGGHPFQICALVFSPDGKRLASSGGELAARLWDVATGREVEHRVGHFTGIHAMAVSIADGTVFTRGNDDALVIHWDPADGRALETLTLPPQRYLSLAVSPDGRTLAIGNSDGPTSGLILWNLAEHKELRRIKNTGGGQPVFSPDGRTLALGLWVYDVSTGRRVDAFQRNTADETWFNADGRRLLSVEYDGVRVWDIDAGAEVRRPIQAELKGWFNAAVSADGRLVATGNIGREGRVADEEPSPDPAIRVWELASGKQVAKLVGHVSQSNNLVFSPDGRMVASVSGKYGGERDAGVRVWDIASERQLRRFGYHPDGANSVAYLPGGRSIITSSAVDGMAIVWDVSDLADRRPAAVPDAKRLEALWADLASDDAPKGYRASWDLSVETAVPLLRDRLRPVTSKESSSGPELLRALRAISALERIGSPAAREVLERLARGDSAASITQDAATAMLRLTRRK
jgi:WD40 repeat protein